MEEWAAGRGHQPSLDGGGGGGSLGHTVADDQVCVPALLLLFGQNYPLEDGGELSHQRYENITTAATAAQDIKDRDIFEHGAKVFDTAIATHLTETIRAAVDMMHVENAEFKGRVLGAVIRDMAGRPGAFTPSLHLASEWEALDEGHKGGSR